MTSSLEPTVYALDNADAGMVVIVDDERFTKASQLQANSSLTVCDVSTPNITLSVWVKRAGTEDLTLTLAGGWRINKDGFLFLNGKDTSYMMPAGQWHQVCWLQTENLVSLYVNGDLVAQSEGTFEVSDASLEYQSTLGGSYLAQQMVFDSVLSETEIQSNYLSALPTVKQSFTQAQPLDLNLVNPSDGEFAGYPDNKLFIVDAVGKDTIAQQLVITNVGDELIELTADEQQEATAEHHHFEWRLRNGVITQMADLLLFEVQQGWSISSPQQNPEDASWSVYFLAKAGHSLAAGESLTFPFTYRTADGALGERGTQINLSYQQMTLGENARALVGDRTKQVDILNLSSNNAYITQMNQQITATDSKIDAMEEAARADLEQLKNEVLTSKSELDDKFLGIISDINKRLEVLDAEVDTRAESLNTRIESIESGAPFALTIYAENGLVCKKTDNQFEVRIRNCSDTNIQFEDGAIEIKLPIGTGKECLADTANKCGNSNADNRSDSGGVNTYSWNVTSFAPNEEKVFIFSDVTANSTKGSVQVRAEVLGIKGCQTQELSANLIKTSCNIAPFVGNGSVGIGIDSPSEKLEVDGGIKAAYLRDRANPNCIVDPSHTSTLNYVNVNGRLGVGTTSPSEPLEVNGHIKANSLIDRNNPYYGVNPASTSKLNKTQTESLEVTGSKPIFFKRYSSIGDNAYKTTGISASDYNAAIVGMRALDGDINENDDGDIIQVYMYVSSGKWKIRADFRTHGDHENWTIDVMYVSTKLSRREGY